jgi:hypothetical protein
MVAGSWWRVGIWVLVGGFGNLGEAAVVITPTQEVVLSGSGLNEVISDGGAVTVGETLTGYTHLPGNFYEIRVSFRILPDATQTDPNKRFMLSGDYRVFLRHGSGLMTPDTVGSYLLENVGQEYTFPRLGYWDEGGWRLLWRMRRPTASRGIGPWSRGIT